MLLSCLKIIPLQPQWVQTSGNPNLNVTRFAVSGSNIFAGVNSRYDSGGVVLSTDNGTNWTAVNTGLTHMSIQALAIEGDFLFAGGDSTGMMRRPLAEMLSI